MTEDIRDVWKRHIGVSPKRMTCTVAEFIEAKYPDMDKDDRDSLISRLMRRYNVVMRSNRGRPSRLPPASCVVEKERHVEQFIVTRSTPKEHEELARLLQETQGLPRFFKIARQLLKGKYYPETDAPEGSCRYNVRITAPNKDAWTELKAKLPKSTRANYHAVRAAMEAVLDDAADAETAEALARSTVPAKREEGGRIWRAWSILATDSQWDEIKRLAPPDGESRTDWLLALPRQTTDKRYPPSDARQRTLRIPATKREYEAIKIIYDTNPYGRTLALINDLRKLNHAPSH